MTDDEQGPDGPPDGTGSPAGRPASAEAVTQPSPRPQLPPDATLPLDRPPAEPAQPDGPGARKPRSGPRWRTWRELPILVVVVLAIALVVKSFVVQPFFIPSSSMEDTLLVGDKVLVNKLVYHFRSIQPGDIVVFNGAGSWNPAVAASPPASNPVVRGYDVTLRPLFDAIGGLFGTPLGQTDYIKRVIGTPGDKVACCNAQGDVTVNGVALHESSYLYPGAAPSLTRFSVTVPKGRLWVMGDNRQVSDDSRGHMSDPGDGTVPEKEVVGRAFLIIWPPSRWRVLPIPSTFHQRGLTTTAAAALDQGVAVAPQAGYVPLAAGVVGGVPLVWLQWDVRRRLARRRRARRRSG